MQRQRHIFLPFSFVFLRPIYYRQLWFCQSVFCHLVNNVAGLHCWVVSIVVEHIDSAVDLFHRHCSRCNNDSGCNGRQLNCHVNSVSGTIHIGHVSQSCHFVQLVPQLLLSSTCTRMSIPGAASLQTLASKHGSMSICESCYFNLLSLTMPSTFVSFSSDLFCSIIACQ